MLKRIIRFMQGCIFCGSRNHTIFDHNRYFALITLIIILILAISLFFIDNSLCIKLIAAIILGTMFYYYVIRFTDLVTSR